MVIWHVERSQTAGKTYPTVTKAQIKGSWLQKTIITTKKSDP